MRVIPFPADEPLPGQEAWIASLEAALSGESQGPAADAWRELRGQVRSLGPPMTPAFEARLAQRLEQVGALHDDALQLGAQTATEDATDTAGANSAGAASVRRAGTLRRLRRGPRSFSAFAASATVLVALIAALLFVVPRVSGPAVEPATVARTPAKVSSGAATSSAAQPLTPTFGDSSAAGAAAVPESTAGAAGAPGRVQQLAASITLGSTAATLQAIADQVSQLAVRDGGYVQSSTVQVQQQGASEATLTLRLPSARLGAALAAIGRLAPVRAENQSLQDITGAYDSAHRRLRDAEAERRALLRALAAAKTEAQIHSLREQLSASRAAVAGARASVDAVSRRASTAEVGVSILGDAHAASEGLTLHRGLHDAGRVLVVALTVLLIAASILVPLALLLGAGVAARSAWLRYRRERVLDSL